jgi:hypothetical protein
MADTLRGTSDAPSGAFPFHCERSVRLGATAERAFDYLDDFHRLSAHMEGSSPMMAGSAMTITTDERGGRAVGSRVRMQGRVFGLTLSLEQVVTERRPPAAKTWQTIDTRLLVIGQYRLGFRVEPQPAGVRLNVFIDYRLPDGWPARWLGRLFAPAYAWWCIGRMARDAESALGGSP